MKICFAAGILSALIATTALADQYKVEFDGAFNEIHFSNELCEGVFSPTEYKTKHFLVGPTHRTIVSYFDNGEEEGLFHDISFMNNFGYNNDFIYDKELEQNGIQHYVHAEGFINLDVVYIEFEVAAVEGGEELCRATAVYSGFN